MSHYHDSKYLQMNNWLSILVNTYSENPSTGLAKVINYYVERLSQFEEVIYDKELSCQFVQMKRFWFWRSYHRHQS